MPDKKAERPEGQEDQCAEERKYVHFVLMQTRH